MASVFFLYQSNFTESPSADNWTDFKIFNNDNTDNTQLRI